MIRTIAPSAAKPGFRAAAVFFGLFLGIGFGMIRPADPGDGPNYAVAVEGGMFRATQSSFRMLYGSGAPAFSVRLEARLAGGLWAIAGYRLLNVKGATAIAGPAFDDESYSLRFEMKSIQAGLRYAFAFGRIGLFAGAGGSANNYKERWDDVPGLGGSGKKIGWYAELGGTVAPARFLSLFIRGDYSSVPAGQGSALEPNVNLGGLEAAAGLAFRF